MAITAKLDTDPKQDYLLIDCCISRIWDLVSNRSLWNLYFADNTNLDGQRLKGVVAKFPDVGLCRNKNSIDKFLTKKKKWVHIGSDSIAPRLLFLFVMMHWHCWRQGRTIGSQVFADTGVVQHLQNFPCDAIYLYPCPCESEWCWEQGGWNRYSAILMALAWRWSIEISNSYINCHSNHFVNSRCCIWQSARYLQDNPRALWLPGRNYWR